MATLRGRRATPYLLILPGGVWLALFFVLPMGYMVALSLSSGDVVSGFVPGGHWHTYVDAFVTYRTQIVRSLEYGVATTVLQVLIGFPVAYWIAFRGGRYKSLYLFLLLLPFFVSFVLRTVSWKFLLTDEGVLLTPLRHLGLVPAQFHILGTPPAVVLGLTYNFLPFMVLPIYVALERIDVRVVEAARDLYAGPVQTLRRVILPLALPGVFAGVLLTFVPASSDYVNSELLGSSDTFMVGQVIQRQYLTSGNYPTAAALSFMLMAVLLVGIFAYARALGTEDVLKVAAR